MPLPGMPTCTDGWRGRKHNSSVAHRMSGRGTIRAKMNERELLLRCRNGRWSSDTPPLL